MEFGTSELLKTKKSSLVPEARPLVLLPTGSVEQHGSHLPVGTDAMMAQAVADAAAQKCSTPCLVAPAVWFGYSPHHKRFGATVSVSAEVYTSLMRELVNELTASFGPVLIVNGHGGNRGVLSVLVLEGRCEVVNYWDLAPAESTRLFRRDRGSIGHAGQVETSLSLALWPDLVGELDIGHERIDVEHDQQLSPQLGDTGVIGDPSAAEAGIGTSFFTHVVDTLAQLIDGTQWMDTGQAPQLASGDRVGP